MKHKTKKDFLSEMKECHSAMEKAFKEMEFLKGKKLRVDVASFAMESVILLEKAIRRSSDAIGKDKSST